MSLDIDEPQVLINYPDDAFPWHHRVLLRRLRDAVWLVATPDGNVWINTTGSPAMATGGTGDILTGMIAGLVAQHPDNIATAVRAAVWLHGRCGELGAEELTEQCLMATDLLRYLPNAIKALSV